MKLVKFEIQKRDQILCALKPYILITDHNCKMKTYIVAYAVLYFR